MSSWFKTVGNLVNSQNHQFATAKELRSTSVAKILDLLCEGPIEGFVSEKNKTLNGREIIKGVYLNETVVQDSDGNLNFKDISYYFVNGTSDQQAINGFNQSELTIPVNADLKFNSPVNKQITNDYVDSVRITVAVPALYKDPRTGAAVVETSVQFKVEVSTDTAPAYKEIGAANIPEDINPHIISGKALSRYERSMVYRLPAGNTRNIRITRVTPDSTVPELQNSLGWISYSEIISERLNYPNSAMVALEVNAQEFGSIPSRAYLIKGLKVKLPNNYNPITKKYTGVWDGGFKESTAEGANILPNGNFSSGVGDWSHFNCTKTTGSSGTLPTGVTSYCVASATATTTSTDWHDRFGIYKLSSTVPVANGVKYVCRGWYKVSDPKVFAQCIIKGGLIEQMELGNSIDWQQFEVYGVGGTEPYVEFAAWKHGPVLTGEEKVYFANLEICVASTDGREWTDNPVWIFYDLLTNKRYGLGRHVKEDQIDTSTLYTIAQYCDEFVYSGTDIENPISDEIYLQEYPAAATAVAADDGPTPFEYYTNTGKALGHIYGKEPRFSCNTYIQSREDAFKVINDFSSAFRAITYWGSRNLIAVQDSPKDPFIQFTNANVSEEGFVYQSSGKKARHTVAMVRYNDPTDFYRPKIEYVEDIDGIIRYGIREVEVAAFGCTSRGQAHRLGKYILLSELDETETVQFVTGFEGAILAPGQIFKVADKFKAGQRRGFRVSAINGARTTITLNADIELASGITSAKAYFTNPESSDPNTVLFESNITTAAPYTGTSITLQTALPSSVGLNAVCTVETSDLASQVFRCISVEENESNQFSVFGLSYDATKFARVEDVPVLKSTTPTSVIRSTIEAVPQIDITKKVDNLPGKTRIYLRVEWQASPSEKDGGVSYLIKYNYENGGWMDTPLGSTPTTTRFTEVDVTNPGTYTFKVIAIRYNQRSREATASYTLENVTPVSGFSIYGLELKGQGNDTEFLTPDAHFRWKLNSPNRGSEIGSEPHGGDSGEQDPMFRGYEVSILATNGTVLRTESVVDNQYTYTLTKNIEDKGPRREFSISVRAVDVYNNRSVARVLRVANPAPSAPSIEAIGGAGTITIKLGTLVDADAVGYLIFASTSSGFTPAGNAVGEGNLVYKGPNNNFHYPTAPGTTVYFKAAPYDSFGTDSLNYTSEVSATSNFMVDNVAPADVAGFTLTAVNITDPTGQIYYILRANWTHNSEGDMATYSLHLRETSDATGWVAFPVTVGTNRYDWQRLKPNTSYTARIAAVDTSGNYSNYVTASATTLADTTPPAAPTALSATIVFRTVYLKWTNPTDADLDRIDIYENTTNNSGTATKIGESFSDTFVRSFTGTGQLAGDTKYYWLKALDTSGNASGFSTVASTSLAIIPAPTNLSLSTTLSMEANGREQVYIDITWDESTHPEKTGYLVEVSTLSTSGNTYRGNVSSNKTRVSVVGNTLYYVRVRVLDANGGYSPWSTEGSITSTKDTTPPSSPSGLVATSAFKNIFLEWVNPSDADLEYTEVWVASVNNRASATLLDKTVGNTFVHSGLATGDTRYYWLRSVDTSGNQAVNYFPVSATAGVSAVTGTVANTDVSNFAISATKMFTNTIILSGDSWTDNSPGAGYITWNAHTLVYGGASYAISGGNTNLQYVYWTGGTSYSASDTLPTLTDGQFMVATNAKNDAGVALGLHDLAWNAMANAVIGSAYIANAAITNAKIFSLAADKITAGTISSQEIIISGVNGILRSSNFITGSAGWRIKGDGTAEFSGVTVRGEIQATSGKFGNINISNSSVYVGMNAYNNATTPFYIDDTGRLSLRQKLLWDGSALTINGTIQATAGFFGNDASYVAIEGTGLNISTSDSASIRGGATNYDTGTGFWLGKHSGAYKFFIGAAAGNKLLWNGSSLAITGDVTINTGKAGGATGWTISANTISTNQDINVIAAGSTIPTSIFSNDTGFYLKGNGTFRFGSADGTALLKGVSWDGTTFKIRGTLDGVDGTFAGTLTSNTLVTGGLKITSGLGLRSELASGSFTITGGTGNGIQYGAQIDLTGIDYGGAGAGGQLVLQAGEGTNSTIAFHTNISTNGAAHVGVQRMLIETDGLVTIVKANSLGGSPTSDAGNLYVHGNIGVGTPPDTSSSVGKIKTSGEITCASLYSTSSVRFKKNIKQIENGLDIVNSLRGVTFDWKNKDKNNDFGVIAEEIEKVLPSAVGYHNGEIEAVDYGKLSAVLIEAVKELSNQIKELKNASSGN